MVNSDPPLSTFRAPPGGRDPHGGTEEEPWVSRDWAAPARSPFRQLTCWSQLSWALQPISSRSQFTSKMAPYPSGPHTHCLCQRENTAGKRDPSQTRAGLLLCTSGQPPDPLLYAMRSPLSSKQPLLQKHYEVQSTRLSSWLVARSPLSMTFFLYE